eukprot:TRINITY_DN7070_c0_g1_i2.p1 TRINITY_DN7070_c0_g1~~TRINITY_DN7070_c0_g1_i2.p1  ORF type:complete len:158 (+),score=4.99 TRINITY_DN7070_c0_g1_i2:156-629(+)
MHSCTSLEKVPSAVSLQAPEEHTQPSPGAGTTTPGSAQNRMAESLTHIHHKKVAALNKQNKHAAENWNSTATSTDQTSTRVQCSVRQLNVCSGTRKNNDKKTGGSRGGKRSCHPQTTTVAVPPSSSIPNVASTEYQKSLQGHRMPRLSSRLLTEPES